MKTAFKQYVNDMLEDNVKPVEYYLELEKQQIINAYKCGDNEHTCDDNAIDYYNQTFKD